MSASEKLKALGAQFPDGPNTKSVAATLIVALPQIVAVVETAEALTNDWPSEVHGEITGEAFDPLDAALAALDESLS